MWPGYSENMRAVLWMLGRITGTASAQEGLLGLQPSFEEMNKQKAFPLDKKSFEALMDVDPKLLVDEIKSQEEFFAGFKTTPKDFLAELELLKGRVKRAISSK